jgi:drug/metabolite transporter (DMT)-like permease
MSIPWYVMAIGAAVVWGVHYPLLDHALKSVSLASVLLLTLLPVLLIAPWFHREIAADLEVIAGLDWAARGGILAIAVTGTLATVLLLLAIGSKNATLASLIEISYPLFVALFAFLLFREFHLNASALLGGLMVMAGLGLIAFGSR